MECKKIRAWCLQSRKLVFQRQHCCVDKVVLLKLLLYVKQACTLPCLLCPSAQPLSGLGALP